MYLECTDGGINPDWIVNKLVDFHNFCDILSRKMFLYDPKNEYYPDDDNMIVVIQMNRKCHHTPHQASKECDSGGDRTNMNQYQQVVRENQFCMDLAAYKKHLCSLQITKHGVNSFVE